MIINIKTDIRKQIKYVLWFNHDNNIYCVNRMIGEFVDFLTDEKKWKCFIELKHSGGRIGIVFKSSKMATLAEKEFAEWHKDYIIPPIPSFKR